MIKDYISLGELSEAISSPIKWSIVKIVFIKVCEKIAGWYLLLLEK